MDPKKESTSGTALTLEDVTNHFRQWRGKKFRSRCIPERLWDEAVSLIGEYSVNRVSKALVVDFVKLKKKALAVGKETVPDSSRALLFVETSMEAVMPVATAKESHWLLTVEKADHSKLTIHPPSFDDGRLLALIKAFAES